MKINEHLLYIHDYTMLGTIQQPTRRARPGSLCLHWQGRDASVIKRGAVCKQMAPTNRYISSICVDKIQATQNNTMKRGYRWRDRCEGMLSPNRGRRHMSHMIHRRTAPTLRISLLQSSTTTTTPDPDRRQKSDMNESNVDVLVSDLTIPFTHTKSLFCSWRGPAALDT